MMAWSHRDVQGRSASPRFIIGPSLRPSLRRDSSHPDLRTVPEARRHLPQRRLGGVLRPLPGRHVLNPTLGNKGDLGLTPPVAVRPESRDVNEVVLTSQEIAVAAVVMASDAAC